MANLAGFFRRCLRESRPLVPLREEIETVSLYFEILRVRFGEGMDSETIQEILTREYTGVHPSTGLENVIERIRFFYPETSDAITIYSPPPDSEDAGGTEVCITIDKGRLPCIP